MPDSTDNKFLLWTYYQPVIILYLDGEKKTRSNLYIYIYIYFDHIRGARASIGAGQYGKLRGRDSFIMIIEHTTY